MTHDVVYDITCDATHNATHDATRDANCCATQLNRRCGSVTGRRRRLRPSPLRRWRHLRRRRQLVLVSLRARLHRALLRGVCACVAVHREIARGAGSGSRSRAHHVCACVCVCVRAYSIKCDTWVRVTPQLYVCVCEYTCVCVWVMLLCSSMCVCVCVCVRACVCVCCCTQLRQKHVLFEGEFERLLYVTAGGRERLSERTVRARRAVRRPFPWLRLLLPDRIHR